MEEDLKILHVERDVAAKILFKTKTSPTFPLFLSGYANVVGVSREGRGRGGGVQSYKICFHLARLAISNETIFLPWFTNNTLNCFKQFLSITAFPIHG